MVTNDLGACEWFVWDLRRSGLIDRGPLDAVVGEFLKRNPRAEAPALAEYLVHQGTLTAFQAERILNGKSQGLVLGPFVLLEAIGSGSMGQVYKASSKNDSALYAVKVLPRRSMWNVRLARRQVRSFANISQPAIVPFMDVGTAGGLHYLVWPLVEGTTLEAMVQQAGRLGPQQAALYALQVAQGLAIAHQNTLFHGLLKPSNIMVGPDNQARILDFGIGSLLVENEGESLVDTMSTANTLTSGLDCASPESIMEPTNRTPAGDQYSLGCTLYHCLTGRVPFPEGSAVEKMMAHQTKEPTDIRELAPDVPEKLVEVVKRLMAKAPEGRYSGCEDVVEALEPLVGDVRAVPAPVAAGASASSVRGPSASARAGGSQIGMAVRSTGMPSTPPPGRPMSTAGSQLGMNAPVAGRPASPAGSHPGGRVPTQPGSHPGVKTSTAAHGPAAPARGPAAPARGPKLPSRASFQLPPTADAAAETGATAHAATPVEEPSRRGRSAPRAEELGWAEEEVSDRRANGFGPIGLVAAALFIMVTVYLLGTTVLMK